MIRSAALPSLRVCQDEVFGRASTRRVPRLTDSEMFKNSWLTFPERQIIPPLIREAVADSVSLRIPTRT